MTEKLAFIDESGDINFDFSKDPSHVFVVTAVVIEKPKEFVLRTNLEEIRTKHFQQGQLRSQRVGDDETKRIRVCQDLAKQDFRFYSIVVDKKKLVGEWFKYQESFYKFIHSLVDREIFRAFPNIKIVADKFGSPEYMKGMIEYMERRHRPNLFEKAEFDFSGNKDDVFVQLADFICGTIGKSYDGKYKTKNKSGLLEAISPLKIQIKEWPENYSSYIYDYAESNASANDQLIASHSMRIAREYISENSVNYDPVVMNQVSILNYLIFHFNYVDHGEYVYTDRLINLLDDGLRQKMNDKSFRMGIIGKLRDKGVLIASSPTGYKIPASESDMYDYLNKSSSTIKPMIERIKKCRDTVKLATMGNVDLLDKREYEYLRNLLN